MSNEVLIERSLLGLLVTCASSSEAKFAPDVIASATRLLDEPTPHYADLAIRLLEAVGLATGLPSGCAMVPDEETVDRAVAALATVVPVLGVRVGEKPDPEPTGVRLRWVEVGASEGTCMEQVVPMAVIPRSDQIVTVPDGRRAIVSHAEIDYSRAPPLVVIEFSQWD